MHYYHHLKVYNFQYIDKIINLIKYKTLICNKYNELKKLLIDQILQKNNFFILFWKIFLNYVNVVYFTYCRQTFLYQINL